MMRVGLAILALLLDATQVIGTMTVISNPQETDLIGGWPQTLYVSGAGTPTPQSTTTTTSLLTHTSTTTTMPLIHHAAAPLVALEIGGGAAGVAVIVLVGIGFFFWRKRSHRAQARKPLPLPVAMTADVGRHAFGSDQVTSHSSVESSDLDPERDVSLDAHTYVCITPHDSFKKAEKAPTGAKAPADATTMLGTSFLYGSGHNLSAVSGATSVATRTGQSRMADTVELLENKYKPLANFVDRPPSPLLKATEYALELGKFMPEWENSQEAVNEAKKITEYRLAETESKIIDDPGMVFAIVLYSFDTTFNEPTGCRDANFYFQLNQRLRRRDPKFLAVSHGFLYYLMTGLSRLPCFNGDVYRGIDAEKADDVRNKFHFGMRINWSGFTSTTRDLDVANSFAGEGGIILKIRTQTEGSSARDIRNLAAIPDESEVLLLPNTELFVTNTTNDMIELIEMKRTGILQDF